MNVDHLDVDEELRRSDLIHKLKQGEITIAEAHELRDLLEREKHMISQLGNCLAILAVTFLITYVDEYLESRSNRLLTSEGKNMVWMRSNNTVSFI